MMSPIFLHARNLSCCAATRGSPSATALCIVRSIRSRSSLRSKPARPGGASGKAVKADAMALARPSSPSASALPAAPENKGFSPAIRVSFVSFRRPHHHLRASASPRANPVSSAPGGTRGKAPMASANIGTIRGLSGSSLDLSGLRASALCSLSPWGIIGSVVPPA